MSVKLAARLLPLLSFLVIWGPPPLRTDPYARGLDTALVNPLAMDASAALHVGTWVAAGAVATLLFVRHLGTRSPFPSLLLADPPIRWYALFALAATLSVIHSPSPLYTLFFAAKLSVGLAVLGLLSWHSPGQADRLLRLTFLAYGLQAGAIAVLVIAAPELVGGPRAGTRLTGGSLFGDYGESALLLGLLCVTVVLFDQQPSRRILAGAGYIGSLALVVFSSTRSTMAAAAAFAFVMAAAHPRARRYVPLAALATVLTSLLLYPALVQDAVSVVTREGEGLGTLSGRTIAFRYLIDRWQESPWIGYGFAAGSRDLLVTFVATTRLNMGAGHDMLSTVLADLGLVGAAILVIVLLSTWGRLLRLRRSVARWSSEWVVLHQLLCLMTWVTIQGLVGTSIAAPNTIFVVIIVSAWAFRIHVLGAPLPASPTAVARRFSLPPTRYGTY